MQYELHVIDRITLAQVLAGAHAGGSYVFHKMLQKAQGDLSLSEKEVKDIGLVYDKDRMAWKGDMVKSVDLPDPVLKMIRSELERLDKAEQLMPEHVPVYEMFMEAVDEPGPDAKSS